MNTSRDPQRTSVANATVKRQWKKRKSKSMRQHQTQTIKHKMKLVRILIALCQLLSNYVC